ncbi:MAG TPA: hypothetical protein VL633_05695 [Bacteroidota bacterium]|nr:hypothetical protein [Bacteroidota bacterium]
MKMRSEGKDFIEINQSAKMKKEGRQYGAPPRPRINNSSLMRKTPAFC